MAADKKTRVLVLGAGFGGLTFCQHFHPPGTQITVVDRNNHYLFQPLLYQVATAGLSAPEIAQPVRSILANRRDITVLMDEVATIDLTKRRVTFKENVQDYDYLVIALGGVTSYFGHPEWEQFAPGLKNLEDAVHIRNRVLLAFEKAENTEEAEHRRALLTIVVVGGGPTGVELAGAFSELSQKVLRRDFRRIDPTHTHVVLLEAAPVILSHLPPDLSQSAQRQLEHMGVQVRTSMRVANIRPGAVHLANGETILAENIIWAAGVSAAPLTKKLGVELDRAGRIKVKPDLSLPGHPEVFAVGDIALVLDEKGEPVPGVSPAAMQMARHVSKVISTELNSSSNPSARAPFKYWDKGTMATIGRSKAVAMVGRFHFSGLLAWMAWLLVHLVYLIGFRNRLAVLLQWVYSYFTYKRGARIITIPPDLQSKKAAPAKDELTRVSA